MANENMLPDQDVTYLNVMQALVEDKAGKYIQMAGVCPCPRCRIDVVALTLSKMPSKYVVVQKADAVPMSRPIRATRPAAMKSRAAWRSSADPA